jgi:hypothetical protein
MAAVVIDQVEEEAADLQFPKGNYRSIKMFFFSKMYVVSKICV